MFSKDLMISRDFQKITADLRIAFNSSILLGIIRVLGLIVIDRTSVSFLHYKNSLEKLTFEKFIVFSEFDILVQQKCRSSNILEAACSFLIG